MAQEVVRPEVMEEKYALAKIDPIRILVMEMDHRFEGLVYDVTNSKGMAEAKKDRALLRGARVNLEEARKDEKKDILARGKYIDNAAKAIAAIIAKHEEPLDAQIRAEEERKEKERLARQEAETARIVAIQEKLDYFRNIGINLAVASSAAIEELSTKVDVMQITADIYNEFLPQAQKLRNDAATLIRQWHVKAVEREEAEARAAAERIELDRLRKEQEARAAATKEAERLRLIEEEKTRLAARLIEEKALAEAREKLEAKEKAERALLEAERKEWQEKVASEKKQRDAEELERRLKLEVEEAEHKRVRDAEQAEREAYLRKVREEQEAKRMAAAEQEAKVAQERAEIERIRKEQEARERILSERRQLLLDSKRDSQQAALIDIMRMAENTIQFPDHASVRAQIAILAEANLDD